MAYSSSVGIRVGIMAAIAGLSLTGAASAQQLQFSFNFKNLDGVYTNSSSTFSARAANVGPDLRTGGFVTRNVAPGAATAQYSAGFVDQPNPADFGLSLSVFNRLGTVASGSGTFTIKDADGDIMTGTITGDRIADPNTGWKTFGPFVTYSGTLNNVSFTSVVNNTWDGPDGGSFNFATLPGGPTFNGAIVNLFINTGGGFFTDDFGRGTFDAFGSPNPNVPTEVQAQLVPTPGAIGLLALSGAALVRRRRQA